MGRLNEIVDEKEQDYSVDLKGQELRNHEKWAENKRFVQM